MGSTQQLGQGTGGCPHSSWMGQGGSAQQLDRAGGLHSSWMRWGGLHSSWMERGWGGVVLTAPWRHRARQEDAGGETEPL